MTAEYPTRFGSRIRIIKPFTATLLAAMVLLARAFVDYRCNRFFKTGLDIPIPGAAVTLSFPNGAKATRMTRLDGYAFFTGFGVPPGGATISVMLPAMFKGYALASCPTSPATRVLEADDFGAFRSRHVVFGAELIP